MVNCEIIHAETTRGLGYVNHPLLAWSSGGRNHLAAYTVFHRMAFIIFSDISIVIDVQKKENSILSKMGNHLYGSSISVFDGAIVYDTYYCLFWFLDDPVLHHQCLFFQ